MYVVIFRAVPGAMDSDYAQTAARLREMALTSFDCLEFVSVTEGDQEIALSYWPDEASIRQWKTQADHLLAQEQGRGKWYGSYQVEIAEIKRAYGFTKP